MTTRKQQIEDIVNDIMDQPGSYYELIEDCVRARVSQWTDKELKDWSQPE